MTARDEIERAYEYIKRTYASGFYEEDEDPKEIFAKYDAGPKSVTKRP